MPDLKLSQQAVATTLTGTELLYTVQGGVSKRTTVQAVLDKVVVPTTLPASDVSAWAKEATKPVYVYSEVGAEPANVNIQTHVTSAHAPSNATSAGVSGDAHALLPHADVSATAAGVAGDAHASTPHANVNAEVNVNADWDAPSGDAMILHKPTIPSIVGLLNETSHDLLDHAGLTGIPSITGLLNEAAHDILDHTGIPGMYSHPANHPATFIIEDTLHNFVTTTQIAAFHPAVTNPDTHIADNTTAHGGILRLGVTSTTALRGDTAIPTQYTDEMSQDAVAAMFAAGSHTNISFAYDDVNNTISATASGGTPTYSNASPSVITVGGIASGTTFVAKTITQMFDDLLYPTQYPSLNAPGNGFTSSSSGLIEVGTLIGTITFNSSFNRGSISPAYGTDGFRAGLPTNYSYTGTGLPASKSLSTLTDSNVINNYTVVLGAQTWQGRVTYSVGTQPLDSKGGLYNSPLAGSTTGYVSQTITGVYPLYATTTTIGVYTKQALVLHTSTYFSATMVAESGGNKQTMQIPTVATPIVGIQFYNTNNFQWEYILGNAASSLTTFTVSDIVVNSIAYKQYTHNGSTTGSRQLRFYRYRRIANVKSKRNS
jgi:hypothetical protein